MWAIRFLNGPMAGQVINLKTGKNILGRGSQCDIKIPHKGVSKEHLEIEALDEKVIFKDLRSRNGSFINGVRIEHGIIHPGDKLGLHEILVDIIPMQTHAPAPATTSSVAPQIPQNIPEFQQHPAMDGNAALNYQIPPQSSFSGSAQMHQVSTSPEENFTSEENINLELNENKAQEIWSKLQIYIDAVVMPGVYKLPTLVDFKIVVAGLLAIFVIIVTFLSAIPMAQLTKSSIQKESRRRAMTIARSLAQTNHQAILQNRESALSTNNAELEEGVINAIIISHADGSIIAPATKAGEYQDLPFINVARRETKELVEQLGDSTIGASVPISYYDANMGSYRVKAHAIVLYNMGSLAIDDGRTLSLFVQTLLIALIFGALLFFFLYKLMEFPILSLNQQLDIALKEGKDNTEFNFKLPALQKLITNINSLLSRSLEEDDNISPIGGKEAEAENILQLIGYPAIAINAQGLIISVNEPFEAITEQQVFELQNQTIEALPDQALQLNLKDLLERSQEEPSLISTNNLNIAGEEYQINCQSVCSAGQTIDYYLMSLVPIGYNDEAEA